MTDADALSLLPIGVGTAYARPGEAQSSYLVRAGGRSILLDLGAGAMNRLQEAIEPSGIDLIVISHGHPDHCADLLALRVYMAYGPGVGRRIRTLLPEGLRERLLAFGGEDGWGWMEAETLTRRGGDARVGEALVVQREVEHAEPTHAVRVEAGGRSLVYGADGVASPALDEIASGCDLLLLESSFGAERVPSGVMHMSAADAGGTAERAGAGALLLTHCFPEYDRDAAREAAAAAFRGPVAWAEQGRRVFA